MPNTSQPKPILLLAGTLRGEVETFDSKPNASTGEVRTLGRATVLTDDGGFVDVLLPADLRESVPARGPVPVSWMVEVAAYRRQLMSGSGDQRVPWLDANGHPSYTAELSVVLVRDVAEKPAAVGKSRAA